MHEYVQKSRSTTLPRSPASVRGLPPGVLTQVSIPRISGAVPTEASPGAADFTPLNLASSRCAEELRSIRSWNDWVYPGTAVASRSGTFNGDRHGREPDDDAGALSQDMCVRPYDAHPRREALASDREREERDRVPHRVRDSHENHPPGHLTARCERRDRREDRPGARDHDETCAHSNDEAARLAGDRPSRQEEERPLEHPRDPLGEQARREHEQQHDGECSKKVFGEPERAQKSRAGEREGRERDDEPGRDGERPPAALACCAPGQQER